MNWSVWLYSHEDGEWFEIETFDCCEDAYQFRDERNKGLDPKAVTRYEAFRCDRAPIFFKQNGRENDPGIL